MSVFRLDYINKFRPGTVEKMTELRNKYLDLEKEIKDIYYEMIPYAPNYINQERVFDETLSHLEQSQMYSIKMLCLLGEDKDGA